MIDRARRGELRQRYTDWVFEQTGHETWRGFVDANTRSEVECAYVQALKDRDDDITVEEAMNERARRQRGRAEDT